MKELFGNQPPVNGDFVTEGTFLALAPSFPSVNRSLPADESRLRRIFSSTQGDLVYATTRGPRPHLLQWAPKGNYGYAVDLGVPEGVLEIDALACRRGRNLDRLFLAGWTGEEVVLWQWTAPLIGHGIQEWNVVKFAPGKNLNLGTNRVHDLALVDEGQTVVLLTGDRILFFALNEQEMSWKGEINLPPCHQRFLAIRVGCLHVLTDSFEILRIDSERGEVARENLWQGKEKLAGPLRLTAGEGWLVVVDAEGKVFEWKIGSKQLRLRGKIPLLPVLGLCRLVDGRIFASAGPEIAHWYVLGEEAGYARDLGVPVSTLSVRRYGLQLGEMLIGRDGEIYLAEDDRGGHLWVYFPPLVS